MAVTVEYIIILTGLITYRGIPIYKIHINKGYFILFDANNNELFVAKRVQGTGGAIVSHYIPFLSFGVVFRLLVPENRLYAVSDEQGQREIECNVTIPDEE